MPREAGAESSPPGAPRTRSVELRPARLAVQRFELAVTAGPDKGKSFTSSGQPVTIGTQESAAFVLTDPTVSRFHCEIEVKAGRPLIRDLGSRNGTVVDGVTVREAELRDGQILALGETRMRFGLGQERVRIPLSERDRFGLMVGRSAAMRAVFSLLERASSSDSTVLLEGETGTGKEAAAESIHMASSRRNGPLVVVDCGAIPSELLESELFGHERGAFTSAASARDGAFQLASGGTIFLDEIGELGHALQPKLLRVLERREIKRVGAGRYQPVDVRVIAATNRNLRREVNLKQFRADLYFRLAVVEVRLPPLRERLEDLPLLVNDLLERADADPAQAERMRGEAFLTELSRHRWSGNVRELRNYIERCLALGDQPPVTELDDGVAAGVDLPPIDPSRPIRIVREQWLGYVETRYLRALLDLHGGNVTAAATAAGLGRVQLWRLLRRHGLR